MLRYALCCIQSLFPHRLMRTDSARNSCADVLDSGRQRPKRSRDPWSKVNRMRTIVAERHFFGLLRTVSLPHVLSLITDGLDMNRKLQVDQTIVLYHTFDIFAKSTAVLGG